MNLTSIVKKLIACSCLLFGAAFSTSAQRVIPVDSSKMQTLRIDPSNAMGGNVSDFFTEVNYIPLETTDECIFGSISKLEITDDYFIIFDYNTHAILIFNKNGKFHAKIKSNETTPIWGFTLNRFAKQIVYSRDNYKTIIYADYDAKTIKTEKFLKSDLAKDEVSGSNSFYFSADKALTYSYANRLDTNDKYYKTYSKSLIVFYNDKNKVYAHGLPFDPREADMQHIGGGVGPLSSFGVDTAFFYSKVYSGKIYTITPNAIQLTYKFIFPFYSSIPADFAVNPIYKQKQVEYVSKHPKEIFNITNFYQINNNLIFRAQTWGWGNKEDNLIYNLKTGTLIAYKHILQDEKSYFLPLYDDLNGGGSFDQSGILACQGGYLYTSASSLAMFSYQEKYGDPITKSTPTFGNETKKSKYPPALETYFKKGSRRDNPVIMQLKLKDDL
ncbi:6-bladed beta-propeller [Mucilaginibacter sp. dw_454]|uniref:6-bladed beta-propeller n=1 Tax=Mucilaginibacter sp. dw_454 TaxID=2720079 RepID=UPI001BD528C5|nr:6-bladed beta-propeller [Mucilaginibacter sp. dw_454]